MSEYPDPDEEFELMYGDDLEVLREHEQENFCDPRNPARRSLNFSSPTVNKASNSNANQYTPSTSFLCDNNINTETNTLDVSGIEDIPESLPSSQKRTVTDLFGDIDDIEFDDDVLHQSKKSRIETEDDLNVALIDRILYERKKRAELSNPVLMLNRDHTVSDSSKNIVNISNTLPRWPYITLTKSDGSKVYVRFHNEEYMEREVDEITRSHDDFKSLLGVAFKDSWKEAKAYLEKKNDQNVVVDVQNDELMVVEMEQSTENNDGSQLWVERYKPMRYVELLSDESTNRTLLQWLKMWDKIVFNKEIKIRKPDTSSKFNKHSGKFEFGFNKKNTLKNAQEDFLFTELDENHTPKYKVALLCGPPGCGKTTLAHMIAKHAGYKVVEINASDDRSVDAFKLALENATQMKSVLDDQKRPNCLVLDEIDGAPLPTIEYLIKFVSGTATVKPKKGAKARSNILKRPVLCICNNVYAPSLRPLKQIAFVVHFPPTEISRLTQRLNEVTLLEGLKVDSSVLTALGEKTQNDIRSCLGVLNFLKSKQKQLRFSDIKNMDIGQKDMSKGLFQVWQEIFQIQQPKLQRFDDVNQVAKSRSTNFMNLGEDGNSASVDATFKGRSKRILDTVYAAGDYEKLIQGVHENFLTMKVRDSMMLGVNQAFEWFLLADVFTAFINRNQNYTLMSYIPYAFVCWHLQFASLNWPKIKFPSQGFEMFQKKNQFSGITTAFEKGLCSQAKPFITKSVLILDSIPLLPHIISPSLRPVNVQLYSEKEKRELNTVVGVMLDYGLQYVQERSQDGTYNYVLDPNISKVGIFNDKSSQVRNLSYALKQLISREVDLEKIKRTELKLNPLNESASKKSETHPVVSSSASVPTKKNTPNHLQRLQPKLIKTAVSSIRTDFFGRMVPNSKMHEKDGKIEQEFFKSPTWYHYKEGYNNAVRRDVKIADLL